MRKILTSIVATLLLIIIAMPMGFVAIAEHMYVSRYNVHVFEHATVNSNFLGKLKHGKKITIKKKKGNWYGISWKTKKGKKTIGWVQGKSLSRHKPATKKKAQSKKKTAAKKKTKAAQNGNTGSTIAPVPVKLDLSSLPDGEYPISFDRNNLLDSNGTLVIENATVYTMDLYDAGTIDKLTKGDIIVLDGKSVEITSIERGDDGTVTINDGADGSGCSLWKTEDGKNYRVALDDDLATYTQQGTATLTFAEDAVFSDSADIEAEPVSAEYDDIASTIADSERDDFDQANTTIRVENGRIVELKRVYTP